MTSRIITRAVGDAKVESAWLTEHSTCTVCGLEDIQSSISTVLDLCIAQHDNEWSVLSYPPLSMKPRLTCDCRMAQFLHA